MLAHQMEPTAVARATEVARRWGRIAQLLCAADRNVRVPAGRTDQMRTLFAGDASSIDCSREADDGLPQGVDVIRYPIFDSL